MTETGRFLARVLGPVSGNVLLRREQYRRADSSHSTAEVARFVLTGKLANCRTVLRRALRDHREKVDTKQIEDALKRIDYSLGRLEHETSIDSMRGIEGAGD